MRKKEVQSCKEQLRHQDGLELRHTLAKKRAWNTAEQEIMEKESVVGQLNADPEAGVSTPK